LSKAFSPKTLSVAILFEASPGFGGNGFENCGRPRARKSQSSLKRVLVSEEMEMNMETGLEIVASQSSLKRVLVSEVDQIYSLLERRRGSQSSLKRVLVSEDELL